MRTTGGPSNDGDKGTDEDAGADEDGGEVDTAGLSICAGFSRSSEMVWVLPLEPMIEKNLGYRR